MKNFLKKKWTKVVDNGQKQNSQQSHVLLDTHNFHSKNDEKINKKAIEIFEHIVGKKYKKIKKNITNCLCIGQNENTPLIVMSSYIRDEKMISLFKDLVQYAASVGAIDYLNHKNQNGHNALMIMGKKLADSDKHNFSALNYLLRNGADPNIRDKDGKTVIYHCTKNFLISIKVFEILIENGAEVNLLTTVGKSFPLMSAAGHFKNNDELILLLLSNGADINLQNNMGNTVLMQLCKSNLNRYYPIIKIIISYPNCNFEIINNDGQTIYDILFNSPNYNKNKEFVPIILNLISDK
jgi:ankyrin repeat protein